MFVFDVTYNKYVISFNDIKSLNDISSAPQILSFGFPGSPHFKPGQIIKIETQNVENQITKELIVVAYGMPSSIILPNVKTKKWSKYVKEESSIY